MDKDHLPLQEDQNPVRRSEIFAGTGSAKVALTEAIKSLSNVSGREADIHHVDSSLSLNAPTHIGYDPLTTPLYVHPQRRTHFSE